MRSRIPARFLLALALPTAVSCHTGSDDTKLRDSVGGEITSLSMQMAVYELGNGKIARRLCPVGQVPRGNYQAFCPQVTHSQSLETAKGIMKKAYVDNGAPAEDTGDAALAQFLALWQQGGARSRGDALGQNPALQSFAPFLVAAVSGEAKEGQANNGGPLTPIPAPQGEGRLAGPVTVGLAPGASFGELRLDNLGGRKLSHLRVELSPGCGFQVSSVMAGQGFGGGSRMLLASDDGVTWRASSKTEMTRLFITVFGRPDACSFTLADVSQQQADEAEDRGIPVGESYYMSMVSYQKKNMGSVGDPYEAHVFASFGVVSKSKEGRVSAREDTISWRPMGHKELDVMDRPLPAQNVSLPESLRQGRESFRVMFRWGPFRISKALYDKAVARKRFLDQWAMYGVKRATANPAFYEGGVPQPGLRLQENGIYYLGMDAGSARSGSLSDPPRGAINSFHALGDVLATGEKGEDWLSSGTSKPWRAAEQTLEYYLVSASTEFMDYPRTGDSLASYVKKMQPVADLLQLGAVPHYGKLPVLGAKKGWTGQPLPQIQ